MRRSARRLCHPVLASRNGCAFPLARLLGLGCAPQVFDVRDAHASRVQRLRYFVREPEHCAAKYLGAQPNLSLELTERHSHSSQLGGKADPKSLVATTLR